jgi:hypothetical protein
MKFTVVLMTQDLCNAIAEAWSQEFRRKLWITLRPRGGVSIKIDGINDAEQEMAVGAYLLKSLLNYFASECEVGDSVVIPGLTPS